MNNHTNYFLPDSGIVSPAQVRTEAGRRLSNDGWTSTFHLHPADVGCDDNAHEEYH